MNDWLQAATKAKAMLRELHAMMLGQPGAGTYYDATATQPLGEVLRAVVPVPLMVEHGSIRCGVTDAGHCSLALAAPHGSTIVPRLHLQVLVATACGHHSSFSSLPAMPVMPKRMCSSLWGWSCTRLASAQLRQSPPCSGRAGMWLLQ